MNRKIKMLLLPMIIAAFLCACGELEVEEGVQINIEESALYKKSDIQSAIDVCVDYFNMNFEGCRLIDISYNEELCQKEKYGWEYQYKEDEAIILTSTFDVDENGGDGSLNPNFTYNNWNWILTRSDSNGGEWTLQTWGY